MCIGLAGCGRKFLRACSPWLVAILIWFLFRSQAVNSWLHHSEVVGLGVFRTYSAVNSWLPDLLKQGYTRPIWPKWILPIGNECSQIQPEDWHEGRFHSIMELLSFERARAGKNLTVYELGCGDCQLCCKLSMVSGIRCVGVDLANSSKHRPNYIQHDLSRFLRIDDADYIMTFENGEHIPPKSEGNYIRTLLQARLGLIVSWARPGQGGYGHYNEQGQSYLQQKIEDQSSLRFCKRRTNEFRRDIHPRSFSMYHRDNPMIFYQGLDGAGSKAFCAEAVLDLEAQLYVTIALAMAGFCFLVSVVRHGSCFVLLKKTTAVMHPPSTVIKKSHWAGEQL